MIRVSASLAAILPDNNARGLVPVRRNSITLEDFSVATEVETVLAAMFMNMKTTNNPPRRIGVTNFSDVTNHHLGALNLFVFLLNYYFSKEENNLYIGLNNNIIDKVS